MTIYLVTYSMKEPKTAIKTFHCSSLQAGVLTCRTAKLSTETMKPTTGPFPPSNQAVLPTSISTKPTTASTSKAAEPEDA